MLSLLFCHFSLFSLLFILFFIPSASPTRLGNITLTYHSAPSLPRVYGDFLDNTALALEVQSSCYFNPYFSIPSFYVSPSIINFQCAVNYAKWALSYLYLDGITNSSLVHSQAQAAIASCSQYTFPSNSSLQGSCLLNNQVTMFLDKAVTSLQYYTSNTTNGSLYTTNESKLHASPILSGLTSRCSPKSVGPFVSLFNLTELTCQNALSHNYSVISAQSIRWDVVGKCNFDPVNGVPSSSLCAQLDCAVAYSKWAICDSALSNVTSTFNLINPMCVQSSAISFLQQCQITLLKAYGPQQTCNNTIGTIIPHPSQISSSLINCQSQASAVFISCLFDPQEDTISLLTREVGTFDCAKSFGLYSICFLRQFKQSLSSTNTSCRGQCEKGSLSLSMVNTTAVEIFTSKVIAFLQPGSSSARSNFTWSVLFNSTQTVVCSSVSSSLISSCLLDPNFDFMTSPVDYEWVCPSVDCAIFLLQYYDCKQNLNSFQNISLSCPLCNNTRNTGAFYSRLLSCRKSITTGQFYNVSSNPFLTSRQCSTAQYAIMTQNSQAVSTSGFSSTCQFPLLYQQYVNQACNYDLTGLTPTLHPFSCQNGDPFCAYSIYQMVKCYNSRTANFTATLPFPSSDQCQSCAASSFPRLVSALQTCANTLGSKSIVFGLLFCPAIPLVQVQQLTFHSPHALNPPFPTMISCDFFRQKVLEWCYFDPELTIISQTQTKTLGQTYGCSYFFAKFALCTLQSSMLNNSCCGCCSANQNIASSLPSVIRNLQSLQLPVGDAIIHNAGVDCANWTMQVLQLCHVDPNTLMPRQLNVSCPSLQCAIASTRWTQCRIARNHLIIQQGSTPSYTNETYDPKPMALLRSCQQAIANNFSFQLPQPVCRNLTNPLTNLSALCHSESPLSISPLTVTVIQKCHFNPSYGVPSWASCKILECAEAFSLWTLCYNNRSAMTVSGFIMDSSIAKNFTFSDVPFAGGLSSSFGCSNSLCLNHGVQEFLTQCASFMTEYRCSPPAANPSPPPTRPFSNSNLILGSQCHSLGDQVKLRCFFDPSLLSLRFGSPPQITLGDYNCAKTFLQWSSCYFTQYPMITNNSCGQYCTSSTQLPKLIGFAANTVQYGAQIQRFFSTPPLFISRISVNGTACVSLNVNSVFADCGIDLNFPPSLNQSFVCPSSQCAVTMTKFAICQSVSGNSSCHAAKNCTNIPFQRSIQFYLAQCKQQLLINRFPVFPPTTCQYIPPALTQVQCDVASQQQRVVDIKATCLFDPRNPIPSGLTCFDPQCQSHFVPYVSCYWLSASTRENFLNPRTGQSIQSCCSVKTDLFSFLSNCVSFISTQLCQTINQTSFVVNSSLSLTFPTAPLNVLAVPSSTVALITWSPPLSSGNTNVFLYEVSPSDPNLPNKLSVGNSLAFQGLQLGQNYSFGVRALNQIGWGPYGTSNDVVLFSAPKSPFITSLIPGNGSVMIYYSMSQQDLQGSPLISYVISLIPQSNFIVPNVSLIISTGLSITMSSLVTGLLNGITYQVSVEATNAAGSSPFSPYKTVTPATSPSPPIIKGNVLFGPLPSQATVRFDSPTNIGGSSLTGFLLIVYEVVGNSLIPVQNFTVGASPAIVNNLIFDKIYIVSIISQNSVGSSTPVMTSPYNHLSWNGINIAQDGMILWVDMQYYNALSQQSNGSITTISPRFFPLNCNDASFDSSISPFSLANGYSYSLPVVSNFTNYTSIFLFLSFPLDARYLSLPSIRFRSDNPLSSFSTIIAVVRYAYLYSPTNFINVLFGSNGPICSSSYNLLSFMTGACGPSQVWMNGILMGQGQNIPISMLNQWTVLTIEYPAAFTPAIGELGSDTRHAFPFYGEIAEIIFFEGELSHDNSTETSNAALRYESQLIAKYNISALASFSYAAGSSTASMSSSSYSLSSLSSGSASARASASLSASASSGGGSASSSVTVGGISSSTSSGAEISPSSSSHSLPPLISSSTIISSTGTGPTAGPGTSTVSSSTQSVGSSSVQSYFSSSSLPSPISSSSTSQLLSLSSSSSSSSSSPAAQPSSSTRLHSPSFIPLTISFVVIFTVVF